MTRACARACLRVCLCVCMCVCLWPERKHYTFERALLLRMCCVRACVYVCICAYSDACICACVCRWSVCMCMCVFVCAAGGACANKHKNRHAHNAHMHTKRTQSLHLLSVCCFWVGPLANEGAQHSLYTNRSLCLLCTNRSLCLLCYCRLTSVFIGRYFVLVQASSTLAEADSLVNVTLRGELKKIRFMFFVL